MDSMNDLVMTVVRGYDWAPLKHYAVSLARCGFKGTKLMLVQNISELARKNLLDLGFKLVDFSVVDPLRGFGTIRFEPAAEFLRNNKGFRYVICTDMRDVVYQSDPSVWLEQHLSPYRLLASSEGVLIKHEHYNDQWVRQAFPEDHVWIREHEVCNSGAIAGDAEMMLAVFEKIYEISLLSNENTGGFLDQGLWNYVLRISPFKEVIRISKTDESFFTSCNWFLVHDAGRSAESTYGWMWIDKPPVMREGLVYPVGSSEPYCIVHQYDRDDEWKAAVEQRYNSDTMAGPTAPPRLAPRVVLAPVAVPVTFAAVEPKRVLRWRQR